MDDYISRQAAIDKLMELSIAREHWISIEGVHERLGINATICAIEDLPSADAINVVRCKDCKHWMPYDWMFSEVWRSVSMDDYSDDEIGCVYCDMNMHANDFCSRAERRTDETD